MVTLSQGELNSQRERESSLERNEMGTLAQDCLVLQHKSKATALFFMLILWSLFITSAKAITEQEALITIKEKWGADSLMWNLSTNKCKDWEGVKCNTQEQVIYLNLANKGLKGPVPDEIGSLPYLTFLDISNMGDIPNAVSGDLSALGSLKNLNTLNVSFNILITEFPQAVLQLTKLVDLRLDNLYMIGKFPKEIGKLKNLQYLYLGNNSMTGPLPPELGNLIQLKELSLWSNIFDSEIPPEIGNIAELNYLNLHNCSLWGGLPFEFAKLKKMERLHLYENKLTGRVPDIWKEMNNLKDLRFHVNSLTGEDFPSWILELQTLQRMTISANQLYSKFPDISHTNFNFVRLECNYFTGDPPPKPPENVILYSEWNCFTNVTVSNDASSYYCHRKYSCIGFPAALNIYGCPPCPDNQVFSNESSCICKVPQKGSDGLIIVKIVIPIVAVLVIALTTVGFFIYQRANTKFRTLSRFQAFFPNRGESGPWEVPKEIQKFTYEELSKATANFNKRNEIGIGGFGRVFLGTLTSGKRVAIKRASLSSMQESSQFRNEVLLLSRLHHRNLVQLEGFCDDDGLQIIVYEFVPNGNLRTLLIDGKLRNSLSWCKRIEIALGIAQGLNYLHSFADPPVIHRDIKPSNVLLDANLLPKLADFGLSKATLEYETHFSTTPAGTAGYMDPQYFLKRKLTPASDVYGFGVLLLELITSQKVLDPQRMEDNNLVELVKHKLNLGVNSIVDPSISNNYPNSVFEEVIRIALCCVSFESEDRPTMKEIINTLEMHLQTLPPPSTTHLQAGSSNSFVEINRQDFGNSIRLCSEPSMELHTAVLHPR